MAVTDWSATASENTSVGGVSIAEGCPAKGLNNAIREVMAAVKTRDGQVVHTSGDETIGGTKTFSSPISGDVTGNAGTADKLKTARTLAVSDADASNTGQAQSFDGSGNATLPLPATIKADIVGDLTGDVTGDVTGNLTGDVTGDVTGNLTGDVTGNVTGNVTGDLTGNADTASACSGNSATATKLATARTITLSGDVSGSASFDGSSDVTIQATASDNAYLHTSGNETAAGVKTLTGQLNANGGIKINNLEVVAVENNAGAHNGIYRGKDLTNVYTLAQLHTKLAAGDFSDLYIGDYLTKPVSISYSGTLDGETITASFNANMNFRFAHFDYWYGMGDTALNTHHIVLVPDRPFFNVKMRKTNTTAGGVPATNVWTLLQGTIYTALNASGCMDGKILTHRDWIPDSVNANAPSAAGANFTGSTVYTSTMWRDVKCGLLHEPMVYGGTHFSSSGYDTGCGKSQLALFQLEPTWIHCGSNRNHYWLCAVSSASYFAHAHGTGFAANNTASTTYIGVRPFFLIG